MKFKINDRVKILYPCDPYEGEMATVIENETSAVWNGEFETYKVRTDKMLKVINTELDVFYFGAKSLELVKSACKREK